jgi:hypothetical protein
LISVFQTLVPYFGSPILPVVDKRVANPRSLFWISDPPGG